MGVSWAKTGRTAGEMVVVECRHKHGGGWGKVGDVTQLPKGRLVEERKGGQCKRGVKRAKSGWKLRGS